ncbi:hypothetical protein D049_1847A, partial [Vibrio parahaemolyticus VPTS-2010]
MDSPRLARLIL